MFPLLSVPKAEEDDLARGEALEAVADIGIDAVTDEPVVPEAGIVAVVELIGPAEFEGPVVALEPAEHDAAGADGVIKGEIAACGGDAPHAEEGCELQGVMSVVPEGPAQFSGTEPAVVTTEEGARQPFKPGVTADAETEGIGQFVEGDLAGGTQVESQGWGKG